MRTKASKIEINEILLSEILRKPKEFIIAHLELRLTAAQRARLRKMQRQLQAGAPLAYVLGYQWFFGDKFIVNKNVLIPRPETEQLVQLALDYARKNRPEIIADIGTGSGAIIISLAKNLAPRKTKFIAVDISPKTLAVAKLNAKSAKDLQIEFCKGSLVEPIAKKISGKNVLITANLPYLSTKELNEPTIKKEPKLALYGGKKSHQLIEKLINKLAQINFKETEILLEINYNQAGILKKIIKKYLPNAQVRIYKDLAGRNRIVEIYFESTKLAANF